jgi:hypothetical protein
MNITYILLAISIAANAALGWAYLGKRDEAVTHAVREQQVAAVAVDCGKATEQLQTKAEEREQEAEPKREAAKQQAEQHNRKADVILATPPAVPGNVCASAQAVVDDWWEQRK